MTEVRWTRYFLESQDYNFIDNIIYQDNQSATMLETNGKVSGSMITKHINIRFLFVKNCIYKKEVNVERCPTMV